MPASYPSSIFTFTTVNNGDTSDASQIDNPVAEIIAVETGLINGFQHVLKPLSNIGYDLGTTALAWKSLFLGGSSSGNLQVKAAAVAGANSVLTLPGGTTDLSASGGTSQVLKQVSAGAAITVGQLQESDLSDYATGTFTPTITSDAGPNTGQVYSSQQGSYVKVGKLVMASFLVSLSTLGTLSGNVQISGFPFTCENASGADYRCSLMWINVGSAYASMMAEFVVNTTTAYIRPVVAAGVTDSIDPTLVQANLTNTTQFRGTMVYRST